MDNDIEFDSETSCTNCTNSYTYLRRCSNIFCVDGYIDVSDDDEFEFTGRNEMELCETCHGNGYERWCPECGKDVLVSSTEEEI